MIIVVLGRQKRGRIGLKKEGELRETRGWVEGYRISIMERRGEKRGNMMISKTCR